MTQSVPSLDALPQTPDPDNRATFNALAYTFTVSLNPWGAQLVLVAQSVRYNAIEAYNSATAAVDAAALAVQSANAAAAIAAAVKWTSGTTYTDGFVTWSPITKLSYRRNSAGAGTLDPSLDPANWTKVVDTSINTNLATLAQVQAAALCF
jgi:hypothetical protein